MAEQEGKGKMRQKEFQTEDKKTIMKGVIITVYAESSVKNSHGNSDPNKRSKLNQSTCTRPKAPGTNYYDRRAQLLAYSRELREADTPEKVEWTKPRRLSSNQKSKKQRRWMKIPRRIQFSFGIMWDRTKNNWSYKPIICEDDIQAGGSFDGESNRKRKRKYIWRRKSNYKFCKKLTCMLKQVSCGWQCNKGV